MKPQIEQLDDIPVIFRMIKKMKVIEAMDNIFIPHKNWTGITVGELTSIWLCFLISTQDHRLSYFVEWARPRMQTICSLLSKEATVYDFSDDKLELLLGYFSESNQWNSFETIIDHEVIRVFNLETEVLRGDATIGKSFARILKDGLFQYGNSKHFRKDLAQFKTMLCTLDPLGYPLSNLTVSGNSADDPLYIPVIGQAMERLPSTGSLFVGDCKLGSLATRAFIHENEHYYLCPLSGVQLKSGELEVYINNIKSEGIELQKVWKDGKVIAKGYCTIKPHWYTNSNGELISWSEKRHIVRSYAYARTQIEALVKRMDKCFADLLGLNVKKQGKKTFSNISELELECKRIVKHYKMTDIINFEIKKEVTIKQIRAWKDRPAREETQTDYIVAAVKDENKIIQKKKLFGWRVYGTNNTSDDMTVEKAVLLYRKEYIIERRFNYLKNKPLNLLPLFLRTDKYIVGLINVLLLALRVISLIEFNVARNLEKNDKEIAGLYSGNPKHKTRNPSVTLILRAFLGIYCVASLNLKETKIEYDITTLNSLQKRLLRLLDMPYEVYAKFIKTVDYNQNNIILKIKT